MSKLEREREREREIKGKNYKSKYLKDGHDNSDKQNLIGIPMMSEIKKEKKDRW